MMTQERLAEASRDASLLGFALTTSEEGVRLHIVAGAIAHAWSKVGIPLHVGIECTRNALSALTSEVGITHVVHDAIEHRRKLPDLYPEWAHVTAARAVRLTVLALHVWATKGWRR
jgi:dihydroorotase